MMNNIDMSRIDLEKVKAPASKMSPGYDQVAPAQTEPNDEDKSKDAFFAQVAEVTEAMILRHGKDFAIGTLVLAAKFVAEGRSLINRDTGHGEAAGAAKG